MFRLAPAGGMGPVRPDLPPTLLPHAVTLAAPPRDRGRSLLLASVAYLILAAGAVALSRAKPVVYHPPVVTGPPIILPDYLPPAVTPALRLPPPSQPATSAVSPTQAAVASPVLPALDTPPEGIPTGVPTVDHHADLPPANPSRQPRPDGVGLVTPGLGQTQVIAMDSLRVLHQVAPMYPPLARATRVQGLVVLMMTVDAQGTPTDVRVLEGPALLQEEAVRTARQWRFEAARLNGQPVAASFRLTLNFKLR